MLIKNRINLNSKFSLNFIFFFQKIGELAKTNIIPIIESTKARQDFKGLRLLANYGQFSPYCNVENNQVGGVFKNILKIISNSLNLTLVLQEPKPENQNIWAKRQVSIYSFLRNT